MTKIFVTTAETSEDNVQSYRAAMAGFVAQMFHARTVTHLMHLHTRRYAAHKALNEFYDEIVDLTDSLAEAFQGKYGVLQEYPTTQLPYELDAPIQMLEQLDEYIKGVRRLLCAESDTHLQNIVDEIAALTQSTLYKLKFLN